MHRRSVTLVSLLVLKQRYLRRKFRAVCITVESVSYGRIERIRSSTSYYLSVLDGKIHLPRKLSPC